MHIEHAVGKRPGAREARRGFRPGALGAHLRLVQRRTITDITENQLDALLKCMDTDGTDHRGNAERRAFHWNEGHCRLDISPYCG